MSRKAPAYNPQDYAAKKRQQLARAKEIRAERERASAAAAASSGGRGSSAAAASAASFSSSVAGSAVDYNHHHHRRVDVDVAQHVSRAGPIMQAAGERYQLEGDGRAHIDAYREYKKVVGNDDGGTPFTPEE